MNKELKDTTITVYATQDTVESDSFNNTYDENATYPVVNVTELKEALTNGGVVAVTKDIHTNNIEDTAAVLLCRSRRVPSSSTAVPSPASHSAIRMATTS